MNFVSNFDGYVTTITNWFSELKILEDNPELYNNLSSTLNKMLASLEDWLSTSLLTSLSGIVSGLTFRIIGDGVTVTDQVPSSGALIPGGSEVVLYLGGEAPDDKVSVPDLLGKSPSAVEKALKELGLYVRATGVATFTSSTSAAGQSIAPGSEVARGTVIEVQFVEDSISDYN